MHTDAIATEPRALIIEDEVLIAEELKERLSRLGFSVIAAVDSADEGIEIAISECPDVVLLDIRLKGEKDGVQAADEINRQVDVPIVYLTAYSDPRTVERVRKTQFDGFLLKPFHRDDLQSTIQIAMQRHASRIKKKQEEQR